MVSNGFNSYHQICGCKLKSWALATRNSGFGLPAAHLLVNIWRTFRPRFLWESPLLSGTSTLLIILHETSKSCSCSFLFGGQPSSSTNRFHVWSTPDQDHCKLYTWPLWSSVQRKGLGGWWTLYAAMSFSSSLLKYSDRTQIAFVQVGEQWSLGPGCIEKLRNDIATSLVGNDLGTAKRPCKIIPSTGSQQLREPCISELVRCGIGWQKAVFFFWGGKAEMEFHLVKSLICRVWVKKV